MNPIAYLFIDHFLSACKAALYFLLGALAVIPLIRWYPTVCRKACGRLLRFIEKLFGPNPGLFRIAATIFLFNGTAMFIYLSTGAHPLVPSLIAVTTGFTLTLCFSLPQEAESLFGFKTAGPDDWIPSGPLAIAGGVATALIELPCFFYSIGMGITLGQDVSHDQVTYLSGLQTRATVYVTIVLPLLLVSAICETIAIQGIGSRR
jgi:hypothetical protein